MSFDFKIYKSKKKILQHQQFAETFNIPAAESEAAVTPNFHLKSTLKNNNDNNNNYNNNNVQENVHKANIFLNLKLSKQ